MAASLCRRRGKAYDTKSNSEVWTFRLKSIMPTNQESESQNLNSVLVPRSVKPPFVVLRFLLAAAGISAWRSLKNAIKVLIGRKTSFNENSLFLRQYVLHLTGLRPIRKITCTGLPSEGAGSQALMVMNAINFARSFGLAYVHTPFTQIQHAERPMQEWATTWESLFNLGAGEALCGVDRRGAVNFSYNFTDLDLCFGWRCRGDELADRFKAIIPEFRHKYYLNKVYLNNAPPATHEVTVAVHVRRGDVSPVDPGYFTSNETILRTVTAVRSILDARKTNYRIRLYSQGKSADFEDLSQAGVELFLDADALWTMQELIEADILIMAKGCFSYYAALISDGIKIFEPETLSGDDFLPSWKWRSLSPTESSVPCRADGSFDHALFERQLLLVIQAKANADAEAAAKLPPAVSDQKSINERTVPYS
jgi:hypothetical protein